MAAYRIFLRTAAAICLLSTVLLSASCGCGGGSSVTTPDTGYDRGNYYDPPTRIYYPNPYGRSRKTTDWRYKQKWSKKVCCERPARVRFIRERWIAAAGYLPGSENRNVSSGSLNSPTDWRSLRYTPHCGSACLPDNTAAACAMYALSTDTLGDNEVFLELAWEDAPADPETCWVALHRPGGGEEGWNWFKPGEEMRIALTPVSQYQHETVDKQVYLAVVLTGSTPATLRKVALREYELDTLERRKWRDWRGDHELDANALLVLEPHGLPGDPPEAAGNVEALYAFSTYDFEEGDIYVDLDWSSEPLPGDCWIGVFRTGAGGEAWNWFRPGDGWRVALSPIGQYQSAVKDETIYVKVVVTGTQPCVLEMVGLREFDFDFVD